MTNSNITTELHWNAPSHVHQERSVWWHIGSVALALLLFAYSIYIKAYTFSVLLVVMSIIHIWLHNKKPEQQRHSITEDGFTWGKHVMKWTHCKSFWIVKHSEYCELHITQRQFMFKEICVHIDADNTEKVFELMSHYTEYDNERGEGWLNYLVRISKL